MSGLEEAERELQKVEEVLAMAEHVIEASRQEQERLSLPAVPEQVEPSSPAVERT